MYPHLLLHTRTNVQLLITSTKSIEYFYFIWPYMYKTFANTKTNYPSKCECVWSRVIKRTKYFYIVVLDIFLWMNYGLFHFIIWMFELIFLVSLPQYILQIHADVWTYKKGEMEENPRENRLVDKRPCQ